MKIGVCMFYDDKVYYYANINHKINLLYCDKHDLDLIVSNTPQYKNRHAAWESVPLMYNNLDRCRCILLHRWHRYKPIHKRLSNKRFHI